MKLGTTNIKKYVICIHYRRYQVPKNNKFRDSFQQFN